MEFIDYGLKDYRSMWALQQELQEQMIRDKQNGISTAGCVLLVEHPPVYTLGRNGNEGNILINPTLDEQNKAEVIKVDRGGDITFHGLGQLVVYPIINMEYFKLGVKDFVYNLEEVVIRAIAHYGITGERVQGSTGVWIDKGKPTERKICAIGIKCSHFVTMHGLALNVTTNLSYFNYINPCGFVDKGVTSIEKEIGEKITLDKIKPIIINKFKTIFVKK